MARTKKYPYIPVSSQPSATGPRPMITMDRAILTNLAFYGSMDQLAQVVTITRPHVLRLGLKPKETLKQPRPGIFPPVNMHSVLAWAESLDGSDGYAEEREFLAKLHQTVWNRLPASMLRAFRRGTQ